jgi:hypothetical protein
MIIALAYVTLHASRDMREHGPTIPPHATFLVLMLSPHRRI